MLFLFIFKHYLFGFLVLAISYMLGRRILGRLKFESVWEDFAICGACGLGILSYVVFVAGMVHLLNRVTVLALVIIAVALCASELRTTIGRIGHAIRERSIH